MLAFTLAAVVQVSLLGAQDSNFDRAFRQSIETKRPLVVLIGAKWCPACVKMKNSILPQVDRGGGLNNVVFTYVDLDRQRELASKLSRTKSIPQLIRFDKTQTGWKRQLLVGAKSPKKVQEFINAGLDHADQRDKTVSSSNNKQENQYSRAYNKCIASGRPMVVLLGARWCPACVKMKNSIIPRVAEAGGLNNVEFAYVDFDRQPELAKQLSRGKSIPQLIRLIKTEGGWSSQVMDGAKSPREVQSFIQNGLSITAHQESTSRSGRDRSTASKQSGWAGIFNVIKRPLAKHTQGKNVRR